MGFVRLMSESAAVMGDDATLSAVIASVVELVEPTVHPGDGSAHAFVEKDALDKVVRVWRRPPGTPGSPQCV